MGENLPKTLRRLRACGGGRGRDVGASRGCRDGVVARVGLGTKRILPWLGCSWNTVPEKLGGWAAYRRQRRRLESLEDWLSERFRWHRGNCHVVRQDLAREHSIAVSLRAIERAVAPLGQALRAEARACVRFETLLGELLQSILARCGCRSGISVRGRTTVAVFKSEDPAGFVEMPEKLVLRTDRGPKLTRHQFEAGLNEDAGCPSAGGLAPMSIGVGHGQSR
jgi:hypothetical protein